MRKLIAFTLCLLMLAATASINGASVDKTDKKSPSKVKAEQQKKTESPKLDQPRSSDQKSKKFDDFVDKNGNGIDDRKEKLKSKSAEVKPEEKTKEDK